MNYATSDSSGIFGYVENDNTTSIVKLDYEGNLQVLAYEPVDFHKVNELSVSNENVAYLVDGEIKLIEIGAE